MKQTIIPYKTYCGNCGHSWKLRTRHPKQCPRCGSKYEGEPDIKELPLLIRVKILKGLMKN